ncbi:MAG: hypothetical protein QXW56_09065 [Nitrososphaerota archaeon]
MRVRAESKTEMPAPPRKELKELRVELWAKAKKFKFLAEDSGVLMFRFPTPSRISALSVELDSAI